METTNKYTRAMGSTVHSKDLIWNWKFVFHLPVYIQERVQLSEEQFKIGHVTGLLKDVFQFARVM